MELNIGAESGRSREYILRLITFHKKALVDHSRKKSKNPSTKNPVMGALGPLRLTSSQEELLPYLTLCRQHHRHQGYMVMEQARQRVRLLYMYRPTSDGHPHTYLWQAVLLASCRAVRKQKLVGNCATYVASQALQRVRLWRIMQQT
eukprot:5987892-Pleurochrysis_carterae.AAC.1